MKRGRAILVAAGLLLILATTVAATHNVSTKPTPADVTLASQLLRQKSIKPNSEKYREQIATISAVQHAVFSVAPPGQKKGIPLGQTRELKDLVRLRYGLCFDRSRAIETTLRVAGFKARHVAIYSLRHSRSPLTALATPGVLSHVVTEVKTERGWIIVDSDRPWLGLTKAGEPVSVAKLARIDRNELVGEPYKIFKDRFTWVYGFYSRHGRFYPPYDPIPDVNWSEFRDNVGPSETA
jgi:hypothetical protein